ncbi:MULTISPECIES: 30S ribosomal protein S16 [Trueperella]|uniref:Small ribosomal subunit protein bS16 n=1 Tax=Trueperella pecoris TaxID=2733571 RepID=A0A7M1R2I3_9ACTO|nr:MULTISPECIES: 30S ribosomal protein S16 [Trueperella]QIU86057.1 30S ribosomal protein S16 [Trueperella pyogenes]QOQ39102.1 30S ribosomal protein S16 [Trueperella pecoris]QOR48351.1 30S ribosomal protein S16 [Trueperella pecoris]QTG76090.1 30S ribosomal protein S16 [Trueperella pecoris]WHU61155.1 30S ribosomal protein S16 [Trueperella pyogenes]
MAVKIRLKRMGKIREAHYRVVVVDSKKRRDGRVIEEIGYYNPNTEPSVIDINSERARYWISVGAQPTEPVLAQLKITGDWQAAKGLEGGSTLKTAAVVDVAAQREEATKAVQAEAEKRRADKAKAREEAEAAAKAEAEAEADEAPAEAEEA